MDEAEAWVMSAIPDKDKTGCVLDMRPLVLCKDCIHYRYYGLTEDTVSECGIGHCENQDKDWFCADGEKR